MAKMRQLWYTKDIEKGQSGKFGMEMREVDVPAPGPGQVLVKTAYAAICATDIHMVTMHVLGAKPPMPLGHEASGTVVGMGEGAEKSGLALGDKVTFFPQQPCGQCEWCKSGMGQYCPNSPAISAFADYIVADTVGVYKLPADADLKAYSIVEPTTCVVRAMDIAKIKAGDNVAIAGIGGIGSIILNQIILSGAANITVIEPSVNKHQMAFEMGAKYCIDPFHEDVAARAMSITDGKGFDVVFEASGAPGGAQTPLKILARCGKAVYFAVFPPAYEMPLNLYDLYMKEGTINTVFTSPDLVPRAINSIPRLQTDKIIGKVIPFADWEEGVDAFDSKKYAKVVYKFSD